MDDSERDALEQMISLAASYETTAQALLDMDWVVDGVSPFEASVFVSLGSISEQSAAVAESVLAQAWVVDGVSRAERRAIRGLRGIASDVAVAESIIALSWVADGMSDSEASAIIGIVGKSARFAESVIALSWVADGVSDNEADAISSLGRISNSAAIAESVIAMPWLADGVSDAEARGISGLRDIAGKSAAIAESVIALSWVVDGVSDAEANDIALLDMLAGENAAIAERVIALPWVADGVSDTEADFIERLSYLARSAAAAAAESVIALPWVADGVLDSEKKSAVSALLWITLYDVDAAMRVMDMPFLQTLEGADVAALRSLGYMNADQLADMLSRPMLKDGITDDEAPIVSMLDIVLHYAPDRVDRLLDPDATTVERRTIELPLAGEVDLVIVRTYLGVRRSMDLLENAVREAENLMGEPFPRQYVGLLYENSVASYAAGQHFIGENIAIRPEFDADGGGPYASYAPRIIAHEVAHYYWWGNVRWINEGMAELMELAIERLVGTVKLVDITDVPCKSARSLKELEEIAPKGGEPAFICNYSLGRGLFVNLLRTLGEDAFWEGARNLYAASGGAGVEEVRQAFGANVVVVIDRWYEGR